MLRGAQHGLLLVLLLLLLAALVLPTAFAARLQLPSVPPMPWKKAATGGEEEQNGSSPMTVLQDFWPPWPFNLWQETMDQRRRRRRRHPQQPLEDPSYPSTTPLSSRFPARRRRTTVISSAWTLSQRSVRIAVRNFQELGSHVWFHLPPAAPPFFVALLVASRRSTTTTDAATTKALPLLWHNPVCRQCAIASVSLALVSWGHAQWYRQRRLTPLLLGTTDNKNDITTRVLPPALPPPVEADYATGDADDATCLSISDEDETIAAATTASHHWFTQFQRSRAYRRRQRLRLRRQAIYDELVSLQQQSRRRASAHKHTPTTTTNNGCAIITGASQGIGRAMAVELARWNVVSLLVLVARNREALAQVASDIETCYGVPCCVITADLSDRTSAQRIYDTMRHANLPPVDILVNNAGIATYGNVLDQSRDVMDRMLQVNTLSLVSLTHLVARDMQRQRRGRILMVSSVCGAVSGIASVAVYSATKAFENSFGIALGKELEPYGVGVTCLLPGAVRGTQFRDRSDSTTALFWKLPFYAKSAATVAECGVRALLLGETQVTPGVLNRVFLKVLQPICPQRLHNWMAELMWSPPPQWPWWRSSTESGAETATPPPPQQQQPWGRFDLPKTDDGTRVLELIAPDPPAATPSLPPVVAPPDVPEVELLPNKTLEGGSELSPSMGESTSPPLETDILPSSVAVPPTEPEGADEHRPESQQHASAAAPVLAAVPPRLEPQPQQPPPANPASSPPEEPTARLQPVQPRLPPPPVQQSIPIEEPVQPVAPPAATKPTVEPSPQHDESPKPSEAPRADPSLEFLMDRYQRERLSPWGDPMAPYLGGG